MDDNDDKLFDIGLLLVLLVIAMALVMCSCGTCLPSVDRCGISLHHETDHRTH